MTTRTILRWFGFFGLSLSMASCSWTVPFYVINDSADPRVVELTFSKQQRGFLIFDPRHWRIVVWQNGGPDFEHERAIPQNWRENMTIEIPAHSGLRIGHLSNDRYESNQQSFINDRVFNLVRLKAGPIEITRDTFDRHFRKTSAGVVWMLPN